MRRHAPLLGLALCLAGCGGSTNDQTASVSPGAGGSSGAGQGGGGGTTSHAGAGGQAAGNGGTHAGTGGSSAGAGGAAGGGGEHGGAAGAGVGGAGGQTVGGAGGVSAGGGGGATGGTGGSGGQSSIEGSYTLVFGSVKPMGTGGPMPMPPSIGYDMRLDLRLTPAGIQALVTPHFRPTFAMQVTASAGALVLTGSASLFDGASGGSVTDAWTTLTLPLGLEGMGLAGTVSGAGQETIFGGDTEFMQDITGTGTVVPDAVLPEYQTTTGDPAGPPGMMLPWDPILIDASEGVDGTKWLGATTVTTGPGMPSPVAASVIVTPEDVSTLWGGARQLHITTSSWDPGAGLPLLVDVAAGVPDLVGNKAASLGLSIPVAAVGPAMEHHFEGDVVQEALWGAAIPLGSKTGSDPHCAKGGCLQIGPLWTDACKKTPSGVAGRLAATAAGKLSISYRITSPGQGGGAPGSFPPYFDVVLASHATAATVALPALTPGDFTDQGAAAGDERFVTAWRTELFDFPDPGPSGEIGFAFRAGAADTCLGFTPQPSPMTIYVDDVVIAP